MNNVTEIERAAITIISRAQTSQYPPLIDYLRRIVDDSDFKEFWSDDLWEVVRESRGDGFQAYSEYLPDPALDGKPAHQKVNILDEAALRLAGQIVKYRNDGRPDGDVSHDIMGMGTPVMTVMSSLAAAVAEYVEQIADAWAIR